MIHEVRKVRMTSDELIAALQRGHRDFSHTTFIDRVHLDHTRGFNLNAQVLDFSDSVFLEDADLGGLQCKALLLNNIEAKARFSIFSTEAWIIESRESIFTQRMALMNTSVGRWENASTKYLDSLFMASSPIMQVMFDGVESPETCLESHNFGVISASTENADLGTVREYQKLARVG